MYHITIHDLIQSLRKAAASPEAHEPAQQSYFSKIQENSVLVNCGTACCIAGDLMLKEYEGNQASDVEINRIIHLHSIEPDTWAAAMLGLTEVEATLAFDCNTHYEIHLLLADLLEAGLRLPGTGRVGLSFDSTYTDFDSAYLEDEDRFLNLQELKEWMVAMAK